MTSTRNHNDPQPEIRILTISSIRKDGSTQQRFAMNAETVTEYAALMRDGVQFPAIRVWWDGESYWLTDGFHRLAAAERSDHTEISCAVLSGTLSDARWDSYAANTSHGLRRIPAEAQKVIILTLQHSNAASLSNMQIAKHLNVAEITIRRWRKKLSSTDGEDAVRLVSRRGTQYQQKTVNIGNNSHPERRKSRNDLKADLEEMKKNASSTVRRLLNVVGNWAIGRTKPKDCLASIEQIFHEAQTISGSRGPLAKALSGPSRDPSVPI